MYLDPLELEGLTRVRYKPIPLLPPRSEHADETTPRTDGTMEPLQNEFALVSVGVARVGSEEALLIRDMNAGQAVLLRAYELDALLRARHLLPLRAAEKHDGNLLGQFSRAGPSCRRFRSE